MLHIGSFRDISERYDEIWLIVRSLKQMPNSNGKTKIIHVPQLSPSTELFYKYLGLKKENNWNKKNFEKIYLPKFLQEMTQPESKKALNKLYYTAKEKEVLAVCYCTEEALCHRSIICGLMQGVSKNNTIVNHNMDYSKYYEMFLKLSNPFANKIAEGNFKDETEFYLLVAGSRSYNDYNEMSKVLDYILQEQIKKGNKIIIVSGGAKGADTLAERYANEKGYEKKIMPANWEKHGKSAGYKRNEDMHLFISHTNRKRGIICFWDLQSKGTQHNFKLAEQYGNQLKVFDIINHRFIKVTV